MCVCVSKLCQQKSQGCVNIHTKNMNCILWCSQLKPAYNIILWYNGFDSACQTTIKYQDSSHLVLQKASRRWEFWALFGRLMNLQPSLHRFYPLSQLLTQPAVTVRPCQKFRSQFRSPLRPLGSESVNCRKSTAKIQPNDLFTGPRAAKKNGIPEIWHFFFDQQKLYPNTWEIPILFWKLFEKWVTAINKKSLPSFRTAPGPQGSTKCGLWIVAKRAPPCNTNVQVNEGWTRWIETLQICGYQLLGFLWISWEGSCYTGCKPAPPFPNKTCRETRVPGPLFKRFSLRAMRWNHGLPVSEVSRFAGLKPFNSVWKPKKAIHKGGE